MPVIRIKRANPGDVVTFTADTYNLWATLLEAANNWEVGPPLMMQGDNQAGRILTVALPPGPVTAKITGSSSLTGGYYTCRIVTGYAGPDPTADTSLPDTGEDLPAADDAIFENPPEVGTGSHLLAAGTFVTGYFAGFTTGATQKPLVRGVVPDLHPDVKILGTSGMGAGYYTGAVWDAPTGPIDPTIALAESDTGTPGAACIVYNRREVGGAMPPLDLTGTYQPLVFPGTYRGVTDDGTPVYAVDATQDQACST